MASCKDCVHIEVCQKTRIMNPAYDYAPKCNDFKDRFHFVELPSIDDYEETELLDIAIDYCYKVAMSSDPNICAEYKAEHMRLCGWLR